ncbi:hypothetical protein DRJ04_06910 [Candidatus Aerophobetes bacterium]|uniref:Uncharacterized protein n=1 Tax=Aerophobetes bacterium TaxID=2030807 RepID=A0A662DD04_UNCAE|nr:MAG: hypothetical protein DRJ04_06910 [Candidatus Aerophobetes bacterium]
MDSIQVQHIHVQHHALLRILHVARKKDNTLGRWFQVMTEAQFQEMHTMSTGMVPLPGALVMVILG